MTIPIGLKGVGWALLGAGPEAGARPSSGSVCSWSAGMFVELLCLVWWEAWSNRNVTFGTRKRDRLDRRFVVATHLIK